MPVFDNWYSVPSPFGTAITNKLFEGADGGSEGIRYRKSRAGSKI